MRMLESVASRRRQSNSPPGHGRALSSAAVGGTSWQQEPLVLVPTRQGLPSSRLSLGPAHPGQPGAPRDWARPSAHLPFPRSAPGRCPGRWAPRGGRCTRRRPSPGSGSRHSASCAGAASCRARTRARAAGTAGGGARPWLSASRGAEAAAAAGPGWGRAGRALPPGPQSFGFAFPKPSPFPAEPSPVLRGPPGRLRCAAR